MQLWPRPSFDPDRQPRFIFIITPPNSGSTALAQILNTSPQTMLLRPNGEGQWLIPGMCEPDRWNPEKEIDYESVRAVWLSAYQAQHAMNTSICVVIEKSPPNMVRLNRLIALFDHVTLLANNRDPYASCASILYRMPDVASFSPEQRIGILQRLAGDWMTRSRLIAALLDLHGCPLLTHEEFCADPSRVLSVPGMPLEVSASLSPSSLVRVKDYGPQPVMCHNQRQISWLSLTEIQAIGTVLGQHLDLLARFGYPLMV
jgi:hypothetical protein